MSSPTGLPPIFEHTPVELAPAEVIAEFPPNTFLESIVVDADNTLFVSNHFDGKVIRLSEDRAPTVHAAIAGKATGLSFAPDGNLLLTGWNEQNISTIFKISLQGTVDRLVELPEAIFLNGLTHFIGNIYLIADSYRGAIWQLDAVQGSYRLWLEHPLLARTSPDKEFPAINGLKILGNVLYGSNTEKQHIVQIPIQANQQPGEPEIFVSQVNIDDFAFDQAGNLYGTTHVYNSVVKIAPDGSVLTIAQAEQGMVGSTALAFGRAAGDRTAVYVVTNGGMSLPLAAGVEPAKIVRLDVGIEGLPLL